MNIWRCAVCYIVPEVAETCTASQSHIFGRTDLRIGVSGAKFDAESDFEVRLAVAPQKPGQNSEKLIFRPKKIVDFVLSATKNEMLGIV